MKFILKYAFTTIAYKVIAIKLVQRTAPNVEKFINNP